jgi:hypothetical protein
MFKHIVRVCLLLGVAVHCAIADEQVRDAQEELRRRNLYFGDIDGQESDDFRNALKRYQMRKGFAATGRLDQTTAASLQIGTQVAATPRQSWPDLPVLKSDSARALPPSEREKIAYEAERDLELATPSPAPPAEQPPDAQNLTPEQVRAYVEQYLRDSEGDSIAAQTRYFAYPVQYFDHGLMGEEFVQKDVANYCRRWPERKYTLTEPVKFAAGPDDETMIEFKIAFTVRNKNHVVTGHTRNFWFVRPDNGDLKIVAIREQRLRN